MNDFDQLLSEMDTFSKAMPAADAGAAEGDDAEGNKKIEAAAADGEGDDAGAEGGDDGDDVMGKSFGVTLENGDKLEAVDGTDLVKALRAEVASLTGALEAANAAIAAHGDDLAKSLRASSATFDLVKSLRGQVEALGRAGSGRRSVVDVRERPDTARTPAVDPNDPMRGMSANDVFAKADALYASGDLTAFDIARIEGHLNGGYGLPTQYHAKIFNAAGARG